MFTQADLVATMDSLVAKSKEASKIQNTTIAAKNESRKIREKREEEQRLKAEHERKKKEEEIFNGATEEELVEAAALLNMSDILTSEQINAVYAGDKPEGSMKSGVKSSKPKQARITKADVETELDVIELNKHLKDDSDALFYLCVS